MLYKFDAMGFRTRYFADIDPGRQLCQIDIHLVFSSIVQADCFYYFIAQQIQYMHCRDIIFQLVIVYGYIFGSRIGIEIDGSPCTVCGDT